MGKQQPEGVAPSPADVHSRVVADIVSGKSTGDIAGRVRQLVDAFAVARSIRQHAGIVLEGQDTSTRLRLWESACDVEDRTAYDLALFVASLHGAAP